MIMVADMIQDKNSERCIFMLSKLLLEKKEPLNYDELYLMKQILEKKADIKRFSDILKEIGR